MFFVLLMGLLLLDEVPPLLVAAYGVLSGVSILMYRADKLAAQRGGWRTSELSLHLVALLGGWPGAMVARQVFRHKTRRDDEGAR